MTWGLAVRALALALGLLAGAGARAEPVVLDALAMRQLAYVALHQGFANKAIEYTDALLIRDPADTTALILKARALRALGNYPESEVWARKAWASAKDDPGRYGSAVTLAQALSLQDRRTLAQLWLRRAVQYAPNDRARQKAEQDFDYVRSQNPLTLQFNFSVGPSDNINGGSRSSVFTIPGFPWDIETPAGNQALSGVATAFGVQGRYRLSQTAVARSELAFEASLQGGLLSDSARTKAPEVKNSDFTLGTIEAGWSRRGVLGEAGTMLTTNARIGHNWYGGDPLANYAKLSLGVDKPLGPGLSGTVGLALGQIWRSGDGTNSLELGVSGAVTRQRPNGDQIRFRLGVDRTISDSSGFDNIEYSANLDWQRAKPVLGMTIGASLGVRLSDYPVSNFTLDGRQDIAVNGSLRAVLNKIDYYGFSPELTLDVSRTNSNAALFENQTIGIGLNIRSNF